MEQPKQKTKQPIEPKILKGFRDLLPHEALAKANMLATLRATFETFGYVPIETPHLEYTEILIGETEGEIGKQLFRFQDQGERDVCLRFDLTVPFARYVVQHKGSLTFPFKRYAMGSVFRGERPQFGRYREFTQCDIDFVGTASMAADAEIIEVSALAMHALNIEDYTIRINNRRIMNGLASCLEVGEYSQELLRVVDKIEKISTDELLEQLMQEAHLSMDTAKEVLEFVTLSKGASTTELFSRLLPWCKRSELLEEGVNQLKELTSYLEGQEEVAGTWQIDLSIARGLGYYTGTVFETKLNQVPELGSVIGGGRYDDLTRNFSKDSLPGVGTSFGIDRLLTGLEKLELLSQRATSAGVLCAVMKSEHMAHAHRVAAKLRSKGVAVEVFPEAAKLKKQLQYGDKKGHNYLIIMGEEEVQASSFTVKNLKSGEQKSVNGFDELLIALATKGE